MKFDFDTVLTLATWNLDKAMQSRYHSFMYPGRFVKCMYREKVKKKFSINTIKKCHMLSGPVMQRLLKISKTHGN